MNYEKALSKHGLNDDDIESLVNTWMQRTEAAGDKVQAKAIYHSAAIDLALGACELSDEVQEGMKEESSARRLLAILTGVEL